MKPSDNILKVSGILNSTKCGKKWSRVLVLLGWILMAAIPDPCEFRPSGRETLERDEPVKRSLYQDPPVGVPCLEASPARTHKPWRVQVLVELEWGVPKESHKQSRLLPVLQFGTSPPVSAPAPCSEWYCAAPATTGSPHAW